MRPPNAIFQVKINASTFNSEIQKKQKSRFFVIFAYATFSRRCHGRVILSYLSVTASKTLPRSEESTGTGRDVAIFGTPKKPKNGLKRIFRPQRRHFLPPCAVRAAARLPAAQRRLTVCPLCLNLSLEAHFSINKTRQYIATEAWAVMGHRAPSLWH